MALVLSSWIVPAELEVPVSVVCVCGFFCILLLFL